MHFSLNSDGGTLSAPSHFCRMSEWWGNLKKRSTKTEARVTARTILTGYAAIRWQWWRLHMSKKPSGTFNNKSLIKLTSSIHIRGHNVCRYSKYMCKKKVQLFWGLKKSTVYSNDSGINLNWQESTWSKFVHPNWVWFFCIVQSNWTIWG